MQYIEDVLVHLCNSEVYDRLTEEEALLCARSLHTEILDWLKEYQSAIGDNAYWFISEHLTSNENSPFGQFYVL